MMPFQRIQTHTHTHTPFFHLQKRTDVGYRPESLKDTFLFTYTDTGIRSPRLTDMNKTKPFTPNES